MHLRKIVARTIIKPSYVLIYVPPSPRRESSSQMSLADSLCPVTKEQFQSVLGDTITDERWESVQNEIVGRMDNFLDQLLDELAQNVQAELDEAELQAEWEDE
jgi:hypothetical protein